MPGLAGELLASFPGVGADERPLGAGERHVADIVDAAMVDFGFAMGPLTLIDMAGIDILALTDKQMCEAFGHHLPLSRVATSLVEQGALGQKTAMGVYRYTEGDYTPLDSDSTRSIIADVQKQAGKTARKVEVEEITDRLILRMAAEAFCMSSETAF